MKKFFIAALFALALTTTAFASPDPGVSSKAAAHLETAYAEAKDISWKVNDEFERASFTIGSQKIDVYYDVWGEFVGTFRTMAYNKLPKAALETLTKEYTFPAYQLKDCIEFTDANNKTSYYVSFSTNDESTVLQIANNGAITPVPANN